MSKVISVFQLGTIDYATGLRFQQRLVELRKEGRIGDVLLLLEHTPVITLGRNAKQRNILASRELLDQRGVEVFECDRGGDVTFHGPGQLVGYPILDLHGFGTPGGKRKTLGAIEYVRRLEEVLIRTCADFGIPSTRVCGLTGVWTATDHVGPVVRPRPGESKTRLHPNNEEATTPCLGTSAFSCTAERNSAGNGSQEAEAKIAAIGVHISGGVTSHGFALNVDTDLDYFNLIIPCGITAKSVTSMARELHRYLPSQDVAHSVSRNFGVVFNGQMLWRENLDALLGHSVGVPMKPPEELRQLHKETEEDTFLA